MIKTVNNFLTFNGNCKEALTFYQEVFGAEIVESVTYGEAEMTDVETEKNKIMNSNFKLGETTFSCFDDLSTTMNSGNQVAFWLELASLDTFNKIYNSFNTFIVVKEVTFWNSVYAKVRDPFGIIWELNFQKED